MDLNDRRDTFAFRQTLKWLALVIISLILLSYAVFQARFLIVGPQINLVNEPGLVQNERGIFIEGKAYNISHLWLNDRQIFTDAQGNFKEAIVLENGYTIITLRAEDRYGRNTTITREFVYTPSSFIE